MRLLFFIQFFFTAIATYGQSTAVDSLKNVVATEKSEQELKALQAQINEYSRTNLTKAIALAHHGVSLSGRQQFWITLSGFYTHLVSLHQNTAHTDSGHFYLDAIQQLAGRVSPKEKEKILANYYSAAGLFYKKQGNYKAAISHMLKAAELAQKVSTPEATAGQYLNVGNTYMNLGDYRNALQNHLKALRLFEAAGNKKGISFSYQSIGEDFIELKRYEKAMVYVRQSLALKTALGDKRGVGNALSGLGRIYLAMKKYDQSLLYMTQALQTARDLQLVREEAKIRVNLGQLFSARNEMSSAMDNFRQGKQLAQEAGDSAAIVLADREMIALETKHRAKEVSEKQLLQNIRTIQSAGNRKEEVSLYKALSELYAENGEAEKSLLYTTKYYEGKDSLLNKDVQMEISRLEEQYKSKKNEAEITLLKKDQQLTQAELKRQKVIQYAFIFFSLLIIAVAVLLVNRYKVISKTKRMVEMEKMRNRIAKDLHDDIGSTLSSINIMSRVLQQQAEAGVADPAGLQKIKDHSAAMMESMSDIVWAINPHNDTAEQILFKMKEFAAEILDPLNINYTFHVQGAVSSLQLDPQKRRDLFLIFKESINNAAKYSQCTHIEILLSANGQTLQMQVTDDGKGFDLQTTKKGNGLKNLNERSVAAGGSISYTSRAGEGTSVQLNVPIT